MGRWLPFVAACGLLIAGCVSGVERTDGEAAPSTAIPPRTTSTTTRATTTTIDPCDGEPYLLTETAGRLVTDCRYQTDNLGTHLSMVGHTHWLNVPLPLGRVVLLRLDPDENGASDGSLAMVKFGTGTDPTDALMQVLNEINSQNPSMLDSSAPEEAQVGGRDAMFMDLVTGEEGDYDPDRLECTPRGQLDGWINSGWVFQLAQSGQKQVGVPACAMSRVWAVSVDDVMLTIVATAGDADFERLLPTFNDFLENNVTFGSVDE